MSFAAYLKEVGRGERGARDLPFDDAKKLFGAMLDGGVPDLELGALLIALRFKTESLTELLGFHAALEERIVQLKAPAGLDSATGGAPAGARVRPVIIPSYNGARRQANLMPLLVMLLKRLQVPVLVHGVLESEGRVAAAYVFRELGVLPQANSRQAQEALLRDGIAFVPIGALAPGLSNLLALRSRLGLRSSAHTLAKLIDPFSGDSALSLIGAGAADGTAPRSGRSGGLRMVSVTHPAYADKMRDFFIESGSAALLMRGTEGEAFANPKRRPQIEYICDGASEVLFEAEHGSIKHLPALPDDCDARTTAQWIRETLDGTHPIPLPIINQLACCLYASGYTDDFTQAKAIAAVKARRPLAA